MYKNIAILLDIMFERTPQLTSNLNSLIGTCNVLTN